VLFVVLCILALVPAQALAQSVNTLPGIVATGTGIASEPAQSATLQFLVTSSQYFGMSGPMMETIEAVPGTPGPAPETGMGPSGTPRLSEDQLDPIVEALVDSGVLREATSITVPAATAFIGPGGPDAGEITVVVDRPDASQLTELVSTVRDVATGTGLEIMHIGAMYEAADCATLVQQARDAAIADARARAEGLATSLGVTLGELVQASENPYYGPPDSGSCAPEGMESAFGPYGPGTYPAFDARSIEATVSIQLSLTYAFGPAA
jgi:uncharacterized protein YggE